MAPKLVNEKKFSLRDAAEQYNLHFSTLSRFIKKMKTGEPVSVEHRPHNVVLTEEQGRKLEKYISKAADSFYRLGPKEIRRLVCQLPARSRLKIPPTWEQNKMAGRDWFAIF